MDAAPSFLVVRMNPETGQLLELRDVEFGALIAAYGEGHELELNGVPLRTVLVGAASGENEHITTLEARLSPAYGAGATLRIRRIITRSGRGVHAGPARAIHIRYEVTRVGNTGSGRQLDYIWQPEIEAPLRVDSLAVLCAPAMWFGDKTRARAIAIGGGGPREHVSVEEGPVAEVAGYLREGFRRAFPGQATIAGALFFDPASEHYTWAVVRRPGTGGRLLFEAQRQPVEFAYFKEMVLQSEIITPAVSFLFGRGMEDADRTLAQQFDRFEEPPEWFYHTTWFWLHPAWQPGGNFAAMAENAALLMDTCGVNGFGLCVHDIPWSGNDVDPGSPQPGPWLGGTEGLKRAVGKLREKGAHTYAWMSRHGHRPDTSGFRESWAIRGIDGRPVRLRGTADAGVNLDIVNPADPTFQEYLCGWIEHYVKDLGITGIFWDSGNQPLPPDFGGKPYLQYPGQAMALPLEFYERVYRFGRSLSPDFFMWVEGISADVPMNAFAVDARRHHGASGHALMHRIAHAGPRRLVWRSAWPHDLASAFPFISPFNDVGWRLDAELYRKVGADRMNQWVCRTVRERGARQAVGIGDGVSVLGEFVVACPSVSGVATVPASLMKGQVLENVHTRQVVRGRAIPAGLEFVLPESGAYVMK